jgi:hypothetical protein
MKNSFLHLKSQDSIFLDFLFLGPSKTSSPADMKKKLVPTIPYKNMRNQISLVISLFSLLIHMTTSSSSSSSSPSSFACPPTPATVHAKCAMTVQFDQPCDVVQTEMIARLRAENNWVDPHNQGTYTLSEANSNSDSTNRLEASRLTGNKMYTDKLAFGFTNSTSQSGCTVSACSVSQVTSILDMSTNYCNLRNLYCNSKQDSCPVVHHELTYKEAYQNCWQRNAAKCIATREKVKEL